MTATNMVKSCWDGRALCRDWGSCPYNDVPEELRWFRLTDIQYCRNQILFIIEHVLNFKGDRYVTELEAWPAESKETGYNDTPVQHSTSNSANFERFRQVTAEVLIRLESAGIDGRLLLLEVKNNRLDLSQEAKRALNYISGWKRKRLSYSFWKRQRSFRGKEA